MIAATTNSAQDQGQRDRKELAKGAWREGSLDNALLLIREVLAEEMSPTVAAECYSTEAAILADLGDFNASLESLAKMAPFLDAADIRIQGTFYNARARAHKNLGDIDSALMDYAGAAAYWQLCGDRNYEGAASINVAELYLALGDLLKAVQNIDHALAVLPQSSEYLCNAYDTKAKILLTDGQVVKASGLIEKALELAGDHEGWQRRFTETQEKIKELLLDTLIPLVDMDDLDDLKVQMIRHALDRSGGSITAAADLINTSHQVIAYTARKHNLERADWRLKYVRSKKSTTKRLS